MKTLNIKSLVFLMAATLTFFSSCTKDEDKVPTPVIDSNLVGEWSVTAGQADVYDAGYLLADVDIETAGTMTFNGDGTGSSDFTMNFGGQVEQTRGDFTWKDEGFEIIITEDGEESRWTQVDDESNLQTIEYTYEDEEDPNIEVHVSLTLIRR